jgi:hypothetical protein
MCILFAKRKLDQADWGSGDAITSHSRGAVFGSQSGRRLS